VKNGSMWVAAIGVVVVASLLSPPEAARTRTPADSERRMLEELITLVAREHVDDREEGELYRIAREAVLRELGDPHTSLLDPSAVERFRERIEGEYAGVGLRLEDTDGIIRIVAAIPGTPAARAGLLPGDVIVEVDGASTDGFSIDDVADQLRGVRGTTVSVRVSREDVRSPVAFRLTR
jgi:carboxyl-terminal processing protease